MQKINTANSDLSQQYYKHNAPERFVTLRGKTSIWISVFAEKELLVKYNTETFGAPFTFYD